MTPARPFPTVRHVLLALPMCMFGSELFSQTVLNVNNVTDLRNAVSSANAAGDFVINIGAGSYVLGGAALDDFNASGDLDITKSSGTLTFVGAGAATTIIDGATVDRVFHLKTGSSVTVTFQNFTIQNGRATDMGLANTEARGGGIYQQNPCSLVLSNVVFIGNEARGANGNNHSSAPTAGRPALGGALYLGGGSVQMTGCSVEANRAQGGKGGNGFDISPNGVAGAAGGAGQGGGLFSGSASVQVSGTTFSINESNGGAGGIGGRGQAGFNSSSTTVPAFPGGAGGAGGAGQGGALYCGGGTITLSLATMTANVVRGGTGGDGGKGGVDTTNGFGGKGGNGGQAGQGQGGALYQSSGTLTLGESTLSANTAEGGTGGKAGNGGEATGGGDGGTGADGGAGRGGAIYLQGGFLTFGAGTISANQAKGGNGALGGNGASGIGVGGDAGKGGNGGQAQGGGCFVEIGAAQVNNSTCSSNTSTGGNAANGGNGGTAGGASNPIAGDGGNGGDGGRGSGGSIAVSAGALELNNATVALGSTVSGTPAAGGVRGQQGTGAQDGSTGITPQTQGGNVWNQAGVDAESTIFAGGTAAQGPDILGNIIAGSCLFQATPAGTVTPGAGVNITANPNLQSLANNGGPTQTHALATGSPAIDAGSNPLALATDQRGAGFVRQSGAATDIGAFELPAPPAAPVLISPSAALVVNAPAQTINGTAPAGLLVRVYNDANNNDIVDLGETVIAQQQLAGAQVAFSIAAPLAQDANNNFLLKAFDSASGIESAATDVPTIREDSQAPLQPSVTSPAAPVTISAANIQIQGSAEAGTLVRIYRDVNANGVADAGEPVAAQNQLATAQTAFSISVSLTVSAVNEFAVTATDAAGNESASADVPTVTENTPIPVLAPVITSPAAPVSVDAPAFTVAGTAQADTLVRIYRDLNNNNAVDSGEVVAASLQLSGGNTGFSISVPLAQSVPNNFVVTATDGAGTESPAADVSTITELAPGVSGNSGSGGGSGCAAAENSGWWLAMFAVLSALVNFTRGRLRRIG